MNSKNYLGLALVGALGAGCHDGNQDSGQPQAIQDRLTLQSFTSCAELEQYIEDTAVRDMRSTLDSYKSGGWLFRGGVAEDAGGAATPGAPSPAPTAYSKTNTQVAGVDEADFMKNDGTRIFVLTGQTLYAAQSWPPQDLKQASQLNIEGYPSEMFLDEHNRVVVFSSIYTRYPWLGIDAPVCNEWTCGYSYGNTTKVTVVDVTDVTHLKVTSERYLPGSYASSRRIGSSVRLVLTDQFRWPTAITWWPAVSDPNLYNDQPAYARWLDQAMERLKVQNEQVIRAATLDQWLPKGRRRLDSGQVVDVSYSCSDFSRANAPVHLGLLSVATLDLDRPAQDPSLTAIIGEAGQVYASTSALYVATPHWWWWPAPGQTDYTYLHKFDISDPDRAVYVASGGVAGTIRDQFSMDEYKDYFRVATSIATRVPDTQNPQNRWGLIQTTNRVSVLGEDAGRLHLIGQTGEISPGETIQSSRFVGNRGFVVTFKQVDPLISVDLSRPQAPQVVGQLQVPGFSTYIQPIDDNTLLTMGVYLPEPDSNGHVDWSQRAMKLSMFDVSDFSHPRQLATQTVGTANGWSDAAYDHKAFNWFPEKKLLAIPFSDWQTCSAQVGCDYWGQFISEVRVFSIDVKQGISARGALSQKDMYERVGDFGWDWYWSPWIRRSVLASSTTSDYVYAVSDTGIRVADLNQIAAPIADVQFTKPKTQ